MLYGELGAKRKMNAAGHALMDAHVDSISSALVDVISDALTAWALETKVSLTAFDHPRWKVAAKLIRPAYATHPNTLTYYRLTTTHLPRAVDETESALWSVIEQADVVFVLADGWEDIVHRHLINICLVLAEGYVFFVNQSTPQGEKEGAEHYMRAMRPVIKKLGAKFGGFNSDLASVLGNDRSAGGSVRDILAREFGHHILLGGCSFHKIDSCFEDLLDNGPASTKQFRVLELSIKKKDSVAAFVTSIAKLFGSTGPRGAAAAFDRQMNAENGNRAAQA